MTGFDLSSYPGVQYQPTLKYRSPLLIDMESIKGALGYMYFVLCHIPLMESLYG